MLIDWDGYLTSLPDFVAELFEGVSYKYTVYADIGLDGRVFVNTGITDLVPSFIEYLVNGFSARSEGSVANIANEIYGDETIEPELKSSRNLSDSDVKLKVSKAKLAASCFKQNTNIGIIFGKLSKPKLLEMSKPGEDLYKRWILLKMV